MQSTNSLEKTLLLGKIEGKRRRGQQRIRWLDIITNSLDMNLSKLLKIVGQRSLACCSPWGHKELNQLSNSKSKTSPRAGSLWEHQFLNLLAKTASSRCTGIRIPYPGSLLLMGIYGRESWRVRKNRGSLSKNKGQDQLSEQSCDKVGSDFSFLAYCTPAGLPSAKLTIRDGMQGKAVNSDQVQRLSDQIFKLKVPISFRALALQMRKQFQRSIRNRPPNTTQ